MFSGYFCCLSVGVLVGHGKNRGWVLLCLGLFGRCMGCVRLWICKVVGIVDFLLRSMIW